MSRLMFRSFKHKKKRKVSIERIWTGVLPSDHSEQRCFWTKTELYQRQEQSGHGLCNFSEWTLTTSQKFDLFTRVSRSLIPNTTSSTDVLLKYYDYNSAISSENEWLCKRDLSQWPWKVIDHYDKNWSNLFFIQELRISTWQPTWTKMLKFLRKSVVDFYWIYTIRNCRRYLNGEFSICFMWTHYINLQLILCSQNMILAFVKNAFHPRVLAREFICYFLTPKCEKKIIFSTEQTFYEFPLTTGTSLKKNQL